MEYQISKERIELLKKHGFGETPDCDVMIAFHSFSMALDTKMSIQGDHATDCAYIFYSRTESNDGELLDGLFHAPSLLEYMLWQYRGEWSFSRMLGNINRQLGNSIRLVSVGGIPMLYCELSDVDWTDCYFNFSVSDMLKLVGQLDYLLPRTLARIEAKR